MAGFLNIRAMLSLNASGFQIGMKQAQSQAKAFAHEIKAELARAFGTAALLEFSRRIIETADHIGDLSSEFGISAQSLQEWFYAAKKTGSSADDVEKFFAAIAESKQNAIDGNEKAIESYQRLGLSVLQLSHLRVDDIGKKIGEAFRTGDPQELLPFLRDIGGKTARKLIPAFREGLGELFKNANDAGAVWSPETTAELKRAREEVLQLADTFAGPLARAIAYTAGLVDTLFNGIRKQVGGAAAYWGAFTAGIDPSKDMTKFDWKEANKAGLSAMQSAQSEIQSQIDAQQKKFQARVNDLKGTEGTQSGNSSTGAKRILNLGMRVVGESSKPEGLSDWQRLGAAIHQDSTTPILKSIDNNTEKTAERIEALKSLFNNSTSNSGSGLGGGF
jgi:hypothetical protein